MEKLAAFEALGLSAETIKALALKGFEEPTPIQEKTIPLLLAGGRNLIGQAQTGTGKTAAFGLPLIERIDPDERDVQALILVPTRELAIQVAEEISSFKGKRRLQILPVYGGQSIDQQLRRLKKDVHIVVGTPGRIIDHIQRGTLKLANIKYMILDEADEMLNMGFIEDVEHILEQTPAEKTMLLFSATMPDEILHIARKYMGDYETIKIKKQQMTTELTDQIYFEVNEEDKFEALSRIIDIEDEFYGLIFCRTKVDVDNVTSKLIDRGYEAEALHGDVSQYQRERILKKFKSQQLNILVATDVAARGIDINDLSHVINFALPQDPESYVHRIGRTGRAGKQGTAITFVTPSEYRKLIFIQRIARTEIRKKKIPGVQEIITAKRNRLMQEVQEIINSGQTADFLEIANELLASQAPEQVLAGLLKYAFHDELDESSYNEIRDVSQGSVDRKGKARLFIAKGRDDNMSPRRLLDIIIEQVPIDARKIRDIKIMEKFSFFTVSFEEAELILDAFRRNRNGRKPLVERAKERNDGPRRPHRFGARGN